MSDHDQEQLEYNDGIGDLLRNKDPRKFSWLKTGITFILFIVGVFVTLNFLFSYGKSVLTSPSDQKAGALQENFQSDFDKIEANNADINTEIEKSLENIPPTPVVAVKPPVKTIPKVVPVAPKVAGAVVKPAEIKKVEVKKVAEVKPVIVKEVIVKKEIAKKEVKKEVKVVSKKATGTPYKVISGSFDSAEKAKAQKEALIKKGYPAFTKAITENGKTTYQIQSGAFSTNKKAAQFKADLDKIGFASVIAPQ